jgi:hypothetical protein
MRIMVVFIRWNIPCCMDMLQYIKGLESSVGSFGPSIFGAISLTRRSGDRLREDISRFPCGKRSLAPSQFSDEVQLDKTKQGLNRGSAGKLTTDSARKVAGESFVFRSTSRRIRPFPDTFREHVHFPTRSESKSHLSLRKNISTVVSLLMVVPAPHRILVSWLPLWARAWMRFCLRCCRAH